MTMTTRQRSSRSSSLSFPFGSVALLVIILYLTWSPSLTPSPEGSRQEKPWGINPWNRSPVADPDAALFNAANDDDATINYLMQPTGQLGQRMYETFAEAWRKVPSIVPSQSNKFTSKAKLFIMEEAFLELVQNETTTESWTSNSTANETKTQETQNVTQSETLKHDVNGTLMEKETKRLNELTILNISEGTKTIKANNISLSNPNNST